jgi:hypothetical protein
MDPTGALLLALALAGLLVAAFGRSKAKTLISGVLIRDRKGRLCLVLTPARNTRRKKPGRGHS